MSHEADWLSGLPFYFLWGLGGINLLAAVSLIAAIGLVLYAHTRLKRHCNSISQLILLPLLLWTVRDGLQPTPQLFDILGMLAFYEVLRSGMTQRRKSCCLFITFLIWANIGPQPIWGLVFLLLFTHQGLHHSEEKRSSRQTHPSGTSPLSQACVLRWLLMALLAGMLTPRGILTWRDSLILFSPGAFSNIELFNEQGWQSAWLHQSWSSSEWAFLILWGGWGCLKILSSRSLIGQNKSANISLSACTWQSILFPLLAAISSQKNIPLCGIWILIDLIHFPVLFQPATDQNNSLTDKISFAVASLVIVAAVADATGYGLNPHHRLGWGIAREIDPRLFDARLVMTSDQQTIAWSPDGRSAGIVSWLDGNLQMADHPQRALLGDRLMSATLLVQDLQGAHRAQYRRDDGDWGGWVRQMSDWNVSMLVIPYEMNSVIRELIRSPWQQVDLDSPCVPFVSSNEPAFTPFILEASRQQGFVEFGPWRPTTDIYSGLGWRYDLIEMAGLGIDPAPAVIQSEIFRAINLPMASLRAMLPVRNGKLHGTLKAEFLRCQIELAYQEWTTFGQASFFRRAIINELTDKPETLNLPWTQLDGAGQTQTVAGWDRCIFYYLNGELPQAITSLSGATNSHAFARAMMQLELGETERVMRELEEILQDKQDDEVFIAASYWKQQVEQLSGK